MEPLKTKIRGMVSRDKFTTTTETGVVLDLSYITDRVIGASLSPAPWTSGEKEERKEEGTKRCGTDVVWLPSKAMATPAEKVEALYRNHTKELAQFFHTNHPGHFMIYNLNERSYDFSKFNNRV